MASTTLKLPDELKSRIVPLARSVGMTPHAWMVAALAAQAEQAERRAAFMRDALDAEHEVRETGEVYRADDVHDYLRARIAGKAAKAPHRVKAMPPVKG